MMLLEESYLSLVWLGWKLSVSFPEFNFMDEAFRFLVLGVAPPARAFFGDRSATLPKEKLSTLDNLMAATRVGERNWGSVSGTRGSRETEPLSSMMRLSVEN